MCAQGPAAQRPPQSLPCIRSMVTGKGHRCGMMSAVDHVAMAVQPQLPCIRSVSCVQGIVLDEVDVLMGDQGAFEQQVAPLLTAVSEGSRLVLVSATLPEPVYTKLQALYPGLAAATGPNLHKIATGATTP